MRLVISLAVILALVFPAALTNAQDAGFAKERLIEISQNDNYELSAEQIEQVKSSCQANKTKLTQLQASTDQSVRKRLVAYGDIQKELKALELRISRQGADASELDLMIGKLEQLLSSFRVLNQQHSDVVAALTLINCQEEPLLYGAGINELRNIRSSMQSQAEQLKDTILQSRQNTFIPLIDRLLI